MKRKLLLLCAFLTSISSFAQETNIVNKDFEDWTDHTYRELDGLTDPIEQKTMYGSTLDSIELSRSTDAVQGSYSLLMQTKIDSDGDTISGYFIAGDWGDNGPAGGEPFTLAADTLRGWWKYDIMPGDTAWIILTLKGAGTELAGGYFPIVGTESAWTDFALPTNYLGGVIDTLFMAITCSNIINDDEGIPGSWLMLDSLTLTKNTGGSAGFTNSNFEDWNDVVITELDDWNTINLTTNRTTSSYSGTYALELEVKSFDFGDGDLDTIGGICANYEFDNQQGGTNYVLSPSALEGYVEYIPSGVDTARIYIQFFAGGSNIGFGYKEYTSATAGYDKFVIDLTSVTATPDTFQVQFFAGENLGSLLRVDALDLLESTVSVSEKDDESIALFPNPTDGLINFQVDANSYEVFNVIGQKVSSGTLNGKRAVDISSVDNGVYFLVLKDQAGTIMATERVTKK